MRFLAMALPTIDVAAARAPWCYRLWAHAA